MHIHSHTRIRDMLPGNRPGLHVCVCVYVLAQGGNHSHIIVEENLDSYCTERSGFPYISKDSAMGGKKTVGAHPTRGHYQNHNTGRHQGAVAETTSTPFTQEFSLFCSDVISDHSAPSAQFPAPTNRGFPPLRTEHGISSHASFEPGLWHSTNDSAWTGLHSHSQVAVIEEELKDVKKSIMNIELSMQNNSEGKNSSPSKQNTKNPVEMKRLLELLRTVEGRQKSIQSKMSHLDSIFGPTSSDWARGSEKLRFILEYFEVMRCGMTAYPTYGYHDPPPQFFAPQYNPYPYPSGGLSPPSYAIDKSGAEPVHCHIQVPEKDLNEGEVQNGMAGESETETKDTRNCDSKECSPKSGVDVESTDEQSSNSFMESEKDEK